MQSRNSDQNQLKFLPLYVELQGFARFLTNVLVFMELRFLVEVSLAQNFSINSRIIHTGKVCDFQSTSGNEKHMDPIDCYYDFGTNAPCSSSEVLECPKHSMHSLTITCLK